MALKHGHLHAGETIIRQGEPGDCLISIQNGTCSFVCGA
jgi:CRP-like cAMP-binding protein